MNITKEDFEAWRDNIVTEEVFRAFEHLADLAQQKWLAMSWGKGQCDPLVLADLRARAQVVEDFRTLRFEDIEEWLKDDGKGD